jgi:hypothetical protein
MLLATFYAYFFVSRKPLDQLASPEASGLQARLGS